MNPELLAFGLSVLKSVEAIRNPVFDLVFRFFDYLGKEPGYLVMAPVLFWVRRDVTAFKLVCGLIGVWFVNAYFKDLVHEVRPFVDGGVTAMIEVKGYSFPSGHAQMAAYFFLALWLVYRSRILGMLGLLAVLGIGGSRIYLGVHYPHDVLGGFLLGGAMALALFAGTRSSTPKWVEWRSWLAFLLPAGMLALRAEVDTVKMSGLLAGLMVAYVDGTKLIVAKPRLYLIIALGLAVEIGAFVGLVVLEQKIAGAAAVVMIFSGYAALGAWLVRAPTVINDWLPLPD